MEELLSWGAFVVIDDWSMLLLLWDLEVGCCLGMSCMFDSSMQEGLQAGFSILASSGGILPVFHAGYQSHSIHQTTLELN